MQSVSTDFDIDSGIFKIYEDLLYSGSGSFNFKKLTGIDPTTKSEYSLEESTMKFESVYDEAEAVVNYDVELSTEGFVSNEFTLDKSVFTYGLKNLSKEIVVFYSDLASKPLDAEMLTNQFMQEGLLEIIQKEPEIYTSFNTAVNGSKAYSTMSMKLADVTELPASLEDSVFWLQHAVVEAKLTAEKDIALFIMKLILEQQLAASPDVANMDPAELAEIVEQQTAATLDGVIQQGMLLETDEGYEVTFTMENAEAFLNGNPFPLGL